MRYPCVREASPVPLVRLFLKCRLPSPPAYAPAHRLRLPALALHKNPNPFADARHYDVTHCAHPQTKTFRTPVFLIRTMAAANMSEVAAAGAAARAVDVLIVGGGIGGAALGRFLERASSNSSPGPSPSYLVVERDTHFSQRAQGYGLTMQQGGTALRKLGLEDTARELDTPNNVHYVFEAPQGELRAAFGRALHLSDSDATGAPAPAPGKQQKLEKKRPNLHLPRQKLRELLLDGVPPEKILWGRRFSGCERVGGDADGDGGVGPVQSDSDRDRYPLQVRECSRIG